MTQLDDHVIDAVLAEMDQPGLVDVVFATEPWEYKIVSSEGIASVEANEAQLQIMGDVGWELVQVVNLQVPFSNDMWYYFKRRKDVSSALGGVPPAGI